MLCYIKLMLMQHQINVDATSYADETSNQMFYNNKKCHSHVTNAPKGIGLA